MPSSTSSSDDHLHVPERVVPGGRWGATWIATAALVIGAIAGLELSVRDAGYRPSVKDDVYAWAWARGRASDGSPRTMAVLGTSRIMLAFDAGAFEDTLPRWRFSQLAVQGKQPIATLRDLALDPDFRGVALVEMTEIGFHPNTWDEQAEWVRAYHRRWRTPGAMAERWLATEVQSRLALLSTTGWGTLRYLWTKGTWPPAPYTVLYADRTRFADYTRIDVEERRQYQLKRLKPNVKEEDADTWLADALALEPFVALIQARGGQVVYLRMPTCDERWTYDQTRTPKDRFWDRFAQQTRAKTLHFADYPTLAALECPDTSHLDSKDGPLLTRTVIEILIERGVITA